MGDDADERWAEQVLDEAMQAGEAAAGELAEQYGPGATAYVLGWLAIRYLQVGAQAQGIGWDVIETAGRRQLALDELAQIRTAGDAAAGD